MNGGLKHYSVLLPRDAYATDVYARNEREARAWVRERFGMRRLPAHTETWEHGK